MRRPRKRARAAWHRLVVVGVATIAGVVSLAAAVAPIPAARVTIDRIQTLGDRELVVWIGLPEEGGPAATRTFDRARFRLDGHSLDVESVVLALERAPRRRVAIVVDAPLLDGASRDTTLEAIRSVAAALEEDDRLLVAVAGERPRIVETDHSEAGRFLRSIPKPATDAPNRLDDALFEVVRRVVRGNGDVRTSVLVWTRGRINPSGRALSDGVALLHGLDRVVTIDAVLVGSDASAPMVSRLERLAAATGGALRRTSGPAGLGAASRAAIEALDRRIRVKLRSKEAMASEVPHVLRVDPADSTTTSTEREFTLAMTRAHSRFDGRAFLIPAVLVVVLGVFAFWRLRPSPRCVIVVASGDDEGCWFEIFDLPATLGYRNRNDIVFDDPSVSGNHATLEADREGIAIRDTVSANGTFVNGIRVGRQRLQDKDRIGLGERVSVVFRVPA